MDEINVRFANGEYVVCKGKCPYGNCLLHCSTLKKKTLLASMDKSFAFVKHTRAQLKNRRE